jgi:PTS system fructose-specific IIC component
MRISDLLTPETVLVPLKRNDKPGILEELLDCVVRTGKITDRRKALEALKSREVLASTGMENGVAIPHARTDAVSDLVVGLGISKLGVDFQSQDGKPSRLFFCFLLPEKTAGSAVQLLARIAFITSDPEFRTRLADASDSAEALDLVRKKEEGNPS